MGNTCDGSYRAYASVTLPTKHPFESRKTPLLTSFHTEFYPPKTAFLPKKGSFQEVVEYFSCTALPFQDALCFQLERSSRDRWLAALHIFHERFELQGAFSVHVAVFGESAIDDARAHGERFVIIDRCTGQIEVGFGKRVS